MTCSCSSVRKAIYRLDESELTVEITTHMESCPACDAMWHQARDARRLIGLKRHERPDPATVQRCVLELHQQIVSWEQGMSHRRREEEANPLTGWRYGMAAAFVAVLAFNLLATQKLPSLQSTVSASSSLVPSAPGLLQFAASNQQFRFNATSPFFLTPVTASNRAHTIHRPSGRSVMTTIQE